MPLFTKHTTPLWGIWKIEESSEILLSMLDNKEYYNLFLSNRMTEGRKCEWLASRVLVKALLGEEPEIRYTSAGAPFLLGKSCQISISHTKGYAAVLLTENKHAGIDIEFLSDRVRKIRSRFMSTDEDLTIDSTHESEHLLIYWSGKETLFKMIGQEEVDFKKHLHIKPFKYEKEGTFNATETRTQKNESFTIHYFVSTEFVLTRSE
jgi:phosphopantetheinyl transferase